MGTHNALTGRLENASVNFLATASIPPRGAKFFLYFCAINLLLVDLLGKFQIRQIKYSAIGTVIVFLCVLGVTTNRILYRILSKKKVIKAKNLTFSFYLPFLVLLIFNSLFRTLSIQSFQNICCFLILPLAIEIGRSYKSEFLTVYALKIITIVISFTSAIYLISTLGFGLGNDVLYGPRSICMTANLAMCILINSPFKKSRSDFGVMSLNFLAVVSTLSRTGIVVSILSLACYAILGKFDSKIQKLLLSLCICFIILINLSASKVQARFDSVGDNAGLFGYRFNTSGRSKIWSILTDRISESPIFGHGVGSSANYISSIFTNVSQPHNDYLRIIYDIGFLGLLLYLLPLLRIFIYFIRFKKKESINELKLARLCGVILLISFFAFMLTDNIAIYSFYLLPLGYTLGVLIERISLIQSMSKSAKNDF